LRAGYKEFKTVLKNGQNASVIGSIWSRSSRVRTLRHNWRRKVFYSV